MPIRILVPSRHPQKSAADMLSRKSQQKLSKVNFTDDDITIFLGEYLSEPKPMCFSTLRPGR